MLIRQSKNTYIRIYDNGTWGYITNQLTKRSQIYLDSGVDFLAQINRVPKDIEDILCALCNIFDVDENTIRTDFIEFVRVLEDYKFVVIGESIKELEANDHDFSYTTDNSNLQINNIAQATDLNTEKNTEDLLFKHDINTHRLHALQVELTSRCNERCIHCYIPNSVKNSGYDLPLDKFKLIIDQFANMGGIEVTLSGGEALINKDIIKMLRYCREKDMQISLLTNLISLSDEHVKVLSDVNISLVRVSLYSMSPRIHDLITTKKGSFRRTKAAIEKLYDANIRVEISCPLIKANRDSYGDVYKYASKMKMRCVSDYIIMAQSNLETANLSNRLSCEDAEIAIRDILNNNQSYFKSGQNTQEDSAEDMPFCSAGFNALAITASGNVLPCPGWERYVVGNVFKESLEDIFKNSTSLNELRNVRRKVLPKCLTCEARNYCGICLARNYNESGGDMLKINPDICDIAFLTKRLVEENQNINNILIELKESPLYNLSLSSKELFHSNFLSWLGNCSTTREFFAKVINQLFPEINLTTNGSWTVEREDKHFDLCIKENEKHLLVIENKLKSIPDKNQLDEYSTKAKNEKTHFMLLTLVDKFPNNNNISPWKVKTYGDLANAMRNSLVDCNLDTYERALLDDYVLFITNLDKLQQQWQNQTTFVPKCPTAFGRLADIYDKIRFSGYAIELKNKIGQISNDIVVYDDSTKQQQVHSSNKLYIKVGWGYTNKSGLIDIAIPVSNLAHPKIAKGVINMSYAIKIQVQGDSYRHVIESFCEQPVNLALIKIGRSDEYTGKRQFFTIDPLNSNLPLPNFGDPSIFTTRVYPINKGKGKKQIQPNYWPFASYKNKKEKKSFIYQSMKINSSVPASVVIDNIVEEVKRYILIFK